MTLIQRFAVQILMALTHCKKNNIIHCDLKPENILLKKINKSGIKIIDFGSGWFADSRIYTYIQSRFYRAPEIVLGISYGVEIDMWSFGWILCELLTGYPLFPCESEQDLILSIQEYLGLPPKSLLEQSTTKYKYYDQDLIPLSLITKKGRETRPGSKNIKDSLKTEDNEFIDFINWCITWDPEDRLTWDEAFNHPWISTFIDGLKVN